MSRILLVNTNRLRPRISPIGLEYVAGSLIASGAELKVFDLAFAKRGFSQELKELLEKFSPLLIGITVRNIDDCYYLSGQSFLNPIRWLISWLRKNSSAKIVLGGVGYSIAPKALLEYLGADYGIYGDGELALVQIFDRTSSDQKIDENLTGVLTPNSKTFHRAELAPDNFPRARNLVNNYSYFQVGGQIGIETKRGCDGKCIYCADPLAKGRKIRMRNPVAVADEIEELISYGVSAFHICDSEFNRPYFHCYQVLEQIQKKGFGKKIELYSYMSPKPFDLDLAQLYRKAGGRGICFGVDSGSEKMLKILNRDHLVRDIEKAVSLSKKVGIKVMLDLLVGGPGENKNTLSETINLMNRLKPDRVGISYGIRVYDKTALKSLIEQEGKGDAEGIVFGGFQNNPELIFPTFYLCPALKKDGLNYLKNCIGKDKRFFLPSTPAKQQNYNYSDNLYLEQLIKKGAKGAYWAILSETTDNA